MDPPPPAMRVMLGNQDIFGHCPPIVSPPPCAYRHPMGQPQPAGPFYSAPPPQYPSTGQNHRISSGAPHHAMSPVVNSCNEGNEIEDNHEVSLFNTDHLTYVSYLSDVDGFGKLQIELQAEEALKKSLIAEKRHVSEMNVHKKRKFTLKNGTTTIEHQKHDIKTTLPVCANSEPFCLLVDDVVDEGLLSRLCAVKTVEGLTDEENELLNTARSQSTTYTARKENVKSVFFETLTFDKNLCRLRKIVDCSPPGEKTRLMLEVFFHLLSGPKSNQKKQVLNKCLVHYAFKALKTVGGESYEPGTCLTNLKMLFAIFKVRR